MTYQELNKYIEHYLVNDKTRSAIMLSADWGTGKSHYVQNSLIPFLEKIERKCVVISLYGMQDTAEISRSIYLETLSQKKSRRYVRKKENLEAYATIVGKSIVKGLISKIGFDASATSYDLQRLYSTVDLSDKLLVLEDVERCQIDINKLLGFVNSLVEQDSVKVLLVTNEKALIKYVEDSENQSCQDIENEELDYKEFWKALNENKAEKKSNPEFTDATKAYLQTKEKTVSDTIIFECNYPEAIKSIILSFQSKWLKPFADSESILEICNLVARRGKANLRTFIFACQKTVDILDKIGNQIELKYVKYIFYSIILFSKKIKRGIFPEWDGTELLSTKLGNTTYPLYRTCYDYIRWQQFDIEELDRAIEFHKEMVLYNRENAPRDPDLEFLGAYYIRTEQAVLDCLNRIESRLDNPESVAFYKYGELVWYLVVCNNVLGYDYSACKEKMLKNIHGKGNKINGEVLFLFYDENNADIDETKYLEFKTDMLQSLNSGRDTICAFNYEPSKIQAYYDHVCTNEKAIASTHQFFSRLDTDKLIDMLFQCNAVQIHDFRGILWAVYRDAYKGKYIDKDRELMQIALDRLSERLNSLPDDTDKIILLQFKYLCGNLRTFIDLLS